MIGTKLAHYEITSHLGTGGMGEVYQATDSKLSRNVAIKILPAAFAADADRLSRFLREAQLLATLNHPNIAHIYGLEQSGDTRCIVMELIEGETLQARIRRGPIPVDETLAIAKQIAEALEAAHEKGVIHRDLKPGNVMLTRDGRVKVLDFGLAKTYDTDPSHSSLSNSPTVGSMAATNAGVVLGTAAYMAPEQARGKPVDKRVDIWAFGAVVFEMVTGKQAFPGDDLTDMIVSVVSKEPNWLTLPAEAPAGFRRLLKRCLKKEPKSRLRDIGDARVQIDELQSGIPEEPAIPSVLTTTSLPSQRSARSRALTWTLAASTIGLAALALMWAPWRATPALGTPLRLTPFSFEQGGQGGPVWSPDGKAVAFAAQQKETDAPQLYVRYLESPVAAQITHLAADVFPIQWTSTGRIVFLSSQPPAGLWSVSPVGGEPEPMQTIKDVREGLSASVSRDGSAMAWLHRGDDGLLNIWISSPPNSMPKPYTPAPFASGTAFNTPTLKFSPDGKQILLIRNANNTGEEAWLMPYPAIPANPPHRIFPELPAYGGTPVFSWMPDNRHIVFSSTPGGAPSQIYMADTVTSKLVVISAGTRSYRSPEVSPDGTKMVFGESTWEFDIVSLDLATAAVTSLIATQRAEQMPAWAAKASALVYVTDRNGAPEIWLHRPGQADRPLVTSQDFPPGTTQWFMTPSLSPDATRVIYTRIERNGPGQLWMSAVAGGSPVQLVKNEMETDYAGSWSPDGNWFVYWHVHRVGATSLYKVKTTGQAEPVVLKDVVIRQGNSVPIWSPSGDGILYAENGLKWISVDGKTTREVSSIPAWAFAFSGDGQTIYGIRPVDEEDLPDMELFSMRVTGGTEKRIGVLAAKYSPSNGLSPALRLSLSPDGKSVTYSTSKGTSNLWLADGLNAVPVP